MNRSLKHLSSRRAVVGATAALAVLLASCGSGGSEDKKSDSAPGGSTVKVDPKAAELVPDDIAKRGVLRGAGSAYSLPMDALVDGKLVGVDPDLGRAIAAKLGLDYKLANVPFDSLVPGLQASRYDIILSEMTASQDRQAVIDQVTYMYEGGNLLLAKDAPDVKVESDMCGFTIAVGKGTSDADFLKGVSKKCVAEGKSAIKLSVFPSSADGALAVQSNRADASGATTLANAMAAKNSPDELKTSSLTYVGVPLGIGVAKDPDGLAPAVLAALESLMADGTYDKILNKYGADMGSTQTCPPVDEAPACVTPGINNSKA